MALAAAAAAVMVGAALAPAAGPVASEVKVLESGPVSGNYLSIGVVTSPRRACVADRRVKFIVKRPGGSELLDVARTSDHGGWTSIVPEADYLDGGVSGTTYKLPARTIEKRGKKIKCGGSRVSPA